MVSADFLASTNNSFGSILTEDSMNSTTRYCRAWACPHTDLPSYGCDIESASIFTVYGVPPNDTTYFSPQVTGFYPGTEYFLSLSSCAKASPTTGTSPSPNASSPMRHNFT